MATSLNLLRKSNGPIPAVFNHNVLGNILKFNTNKHKNLAYNNVSEQVGSQIVGEHLDKSNAQLKYCPYLKPMEIKGIKRADRKFDYNSSYSFMLAQNNFSANPQNRSFLTNILYNGMKIPLPPKRYQMAQYVDVRLDVLSPFIITCVICLPFFFTDFMWSVPEKSSAH
ncbi:conserved Plasmodium protein, unknown function [Plasmodium knowlesi strain H]|uniref:Uncharacterized protein n=3 Tax=Plasmodium knowlesi TaxID=5850 RepID=A0A5K1V0L9_PLAKH|nr:conserved Plasmodium protein, unknown function [Plasmodium knowlesi strain H]OTN65654.1 Uncharacterized protein PKNOH_S110073200 [Plasmodium knowlesi]CAA9989353.1 conserved Plasmodium protein, unknown function [Plasmodium knowlesi strain H]SBO24922.1 conserved Plasmodium protein, unknown function [Plasmodium knowlesi strain H]SBO27919.1 conserved Plasmodium protein, unknown function [Plasmodium knowlesi strain H]VVS78827.1 conserved Plasmodium protein, unknown function [Plasmodium knowlesi |eukprot:XP_002260080.1 hypothetical protein, conserved in Plasmodium species [Plasmodium knowlesi strain H]